MATKLFSKSLVGLAIAAAEIRLDEGWQAANRKGRAAMTRKNYCGNLLWQSGLTLFGTRDSDAAKFRGVYRDSWEMLWMTAIHMKAGCEFMLMGVDW